MDTPHLIVDKVYDITHHYNDNVSLWIIQSETDSTLQFTDRPKHYYIWDYFITLAEWREQQINSIFYD